MVVSVAVALCCVLCLPLSLFRLTKYLCIQNSIFINCIFIPSLERYALERAISNRSPHRPTMDHSISKQAHVARRQRRYIERRKEKRYLSMLVGPVDH